ncbi:unnamed protein product [Rotaria magnacalcarata]|uniref:Coiled-coil domain-containing protein 12 n=1 Tax=Rotaria magnacalcarata TaxID=392030 RepID=A0A816CQ73_9BILA|nr:unnamed protein product [Rotaria magnacalcarata]CAF1624771.1 unnamed protein product [Rotaria magnacalcarata]CAF2264688.1 unnamed protein product [Rotaria magnacalcarata]CAF3820822.1 unnamed protein product [Rotaria magnacalcarata]CAF3822280.1 unnamed protein product [Rotaria magnacalcarata]
MTLSELEEEARKRKERLAQWKLKKQNQTTKRKEYEEDENDNVTEINNKEKDLQETTVEFPKPIFRNYKPNDAAQLSGAIILPKPKLIDIKSMIEDQLKNKSSGNDNSVSGVIEDVDLLSLAPRKPDWDLKRDVEKKLKRLEKRTTRAIAELTRERLLAEQKQSQTSFAEVVATTSKLNEAAQDDDE